MTLLVLLCGVNKKMVYILVGSVIVIFETLALIWLWLSIAKYSNFWKGKKSEIGEITYLVLGDSAAQGIGASHPMKGYAGLIANKIATKRDKTVRIVNLSKTGATIADYLKDQAPQITSFKPDIVTIEIGANDIRKFDPIEYRRLFKEVLSTLPKGTLVANMPFFNSRPLLTKKAEQASKIIQEELLHYPNLVFVDLETETKQHQSLFSFAPDLFHPNNRGYKNWANAFLKKIDA